MQKIIKLRSPSRQLLETVSFAFMKIFDSLVKINKADSLCMEFNMISYLKRWTPNFLQNCQNSQYPLCFCVIVSSS